MSYILHFGELALKGKNRHTFENILLNNLKQKVPDLDYIKEYGRVLINNEGDHVDEAIGSTFGIVNFSKAKRLDYCEDIDKIKDLAYEVVAEHLNKFGGSTFKVETKRSNKQFSIKSMDLSRDVGGFILPKTDLKVSLKSPDFVLYVEIGTKNIYVYVNKQKGIGGLPVGSSGKVVSMLSGGIDSPVSSWMMMKRGCDVTFFHAYNKTLHSDKVLEKNSLLVNQLNKYQGKSHLFLIDYRSIQKEIIENIPDRYRMIVFKRSVFRMANKIAKKVGAKAIVSGDSLGQVASQTLDNINAIYSASDLPIFSPLIGFDKTEIIDISQKINTYDISILPYDDCCSLISTNNPSTSGKVKEIIELEKASDLYEIEDESLIERIEKKFKYNS